MILKGNEDLTDVSILEAMRLFEKERKEDILLDISRNSYNYSFEDYEEDTKYVESFLQNGNETQILDYLKLVKHMMNSDCEDVFAYLLLFSSAKLFASYGDIIKDYLPVHQQLLTEVYMYIPTSRMDSSVEVIMDDKFYERGVSYGETYEDLLNSLNSMVETIEYNYDAEILQNGRILH